jgi:hypothetical protein
VEGERGEFVARADLPGGPHIVEGGYLCPKGGERKIRIVTQKGRRFNREALEKRDRLEVWCQGRSFRYKEGRFEDDFGNRLETRSDGGLLIATGDVIPSFPGQLHLGPVPTIPYRGKRYRLEPFGAEEGFYVASRETDTFNHEYLFRYDPERRGMRLAEGIYKDPQRDQSFYVDGHRYATEFGDASSTGLYRLCRSVTDGKRLVAIEEDFVGRLRLMDKGVPDYPLKSPTEWRDIAYQGGTYHIQYRENGFLFARRLGQRLTGLEENWFVGRIVENGFGRRRPAVIPLTRQEMREELRKQIGRLREYHGQRYGTERVRIRLKKGEEKNQYAWDTRGELPSGNRLQMEEWRLSVGQGHEIKLSIPTIRGERIYSIHDWIRLLQELPPQCLYSTKTIRVVPRGEQLSADGRVVGLFNYEAQRMTLLDGRSDVRDTLLHEMLGHGFERANERIIKMTILAMKLDRRRVSHHGMKNSHEDLAENASLLWRRREFRDLYPYHWEFVQAMAEVDPRGIPQAGATMWLPGKG